MTKIEKILNQSMDRRQFIGVLGLGIITIFGIPSLLGAFSPNDKTQDKQATNGYGASSYGP